MVLQYPAGIYLTQESVHLMAQVVEMVACVIMGAEGRFAPVLRELQEISVKTVSMERVV